MFFRSLPHFITNTICGFIPGVARRKKVRAILNSPFVAELHFVRRCTPEHIRRVRVFVGFMARSLIISANDKYVFKFPLKRADYRELAVREKRVVDALAPYSTIYTPSVELLRNGDDIVRKYDFVSGRGMRTFSAEMILKHKTKLARQIAKFIFEIASVDPVEIRDLKPSPDAKPGYAYGWFQGDIVDNFMIDPKTMNITAFIDWEDCAFRDFSEIFHTEYRSPQRELMDAVRHEYDALYKSGGKRAHRAAANAK